MKFNLYLTLFLFFSFCLFSCTSYSKKWIKAPAHLHRASHKLTTEIEIEKNKYVVMLDTGDPTPLTLNEKAIHKIRNKTALGNKVLYDAKGDSIESPCFQLSSVKIQSLEFANVSVREEDPNDSVIVFSSTSEKRLKRIQAEEACIDGSIGRGILTQYNLYLDPRKSLYFQLTKDKPKLLTHFIETTCEINKFGIILSVQTSVGTKKILLDTGATLSFFNREQIPENLQTPLEDHTQVMNFTAEKLIIGGHDFGKQEFVLIDIPSFLAEGFDGILGMDFFANFITYFDFHNQKVYFKRISSF